MIDPTFFPEHLRTRAMEYVEENPNYEFGEVALTIDARIYAEMMEMTW